MLIAGGQQPMIAISWPQGILQEKKIFYSYQTLECTRGHNQTYIKHDSHVTQYINKLTLTFSTLY